MIPFLLCVYIYGAFLTAYLMGRYSKDKDEVQYVIALAAFWPLIVIPVCAFTLPLALVEYIYKSTREKYWP